MTLAEFIQKNTKFLVDEWLRGVRAARPEGVDSDLADLATRVSGLLEAIAAELARRQRRPAGRAGKAPTLADAAAAYADDRLTQGLRLHQLLPEYEQLRTSVSQAWIQDAERDREALQELQHFNQAIDQCLRVSAEHFSATLDWARDLYLAALGHDIRTPLASMLASAEVMLISKEDIPGSHLSAAVRIRNAAKWIRSMLDDLLDFTRTRFGSPLPIVREAVDLTAVCRQFVGEMQAVYPDWKIRLDCEGDLQGSFDPRRIGQIMANLFASAARYGDARFPVTVTARREGDEAVLSVHNKGEPIPAGPLRIIFSPMAEGGARNGQPGSDRRLGLGLYIAKEIAEAHDGRIGVTSNRAAGTTFELRLPHRPC